MRSVFWKLGNRQMMQTLIIGQCFCYADSGYASGHGCEGRDVGVALGMDALDHRVGLLANRYGRRSDSMVFYIHKDSLGATPLKPYDLVVLCEITGYRNAVGLGLSEAIRQHPCVIGLF